eukprot:1395008-Amorphochlora_amoeboformis.AAC.1
MDVTACMALCALKFDDAAALDLVDLEPSRGDTIRLCILHAIGTQFTVVWTILYFSNRNRSNDPMDQTAMIP